MIPTFDNVERCWSLHLVAHALKHIQRTERIAGALHKQNRSVQGAEDCISKPCSITGRAQRISKANQSVHLFFQGNVAPDTAAHALADQNYSGSDFLSRVGERQPVRRDELSQGIGPLPTLTHVRIIESHNISDC
jgi:hypothetical protein